MDASWGTQSPLPFLTRDHPGTGGRIRQQPGDFRVEESPLYEPSGEGPHYYFVVEKRGLSTREVVRRLARHMEVSERRFGYAGMKDARAITVQRMSLEHADVDRLLDFEDPKVSIRGLDWHRNKLKQGHLEANHFRIRIQGTVPGAASRARRILEVLETRGVPNFFGPQRFGDRGDSAELGKALVQDDLDRFVSGYLGRPRLEDPPDCRRARAAFELGEFEEAMRLWPRRNRRERRALATFLDRRQPGPVLSAVPRWLRRLFVSAFQGQLFNELLSRRIRALDRLYRGDVARVVESGGMFEVEDPAREQPRVPSFEISPTGFLPGSEVWMAGGAPGEWERERLRDHDVTRNDFERVAYLGLKGGRRSLRVRLREAVVRSDESVPSGSLEIRFGLPPGSYATSVIREVTKAPSSRERRMPAGL